jgi:predicted aconitase with swiveling domain
MIANGTSPAGIILGEPDQILTLGSVVGGAMGLGQVPVVQLDPNEFDALPGRLRIAADGRIEACPGRS